MQVNARDVLVIFPTRDSQLFSSLHHSLSKSIVKEMPIKFNRLSSLTDDDRIVSHDAMTP